MRYKPWARPELAACPFNVQNPDEYKGHWKEHFARPDQPLDLELGCGKGTFTAALAANHPERNYVAIDIKSEVLVLAKRNAEKEYALVNRPVDNLLIMSHEIELIENMLDENDVFSNIYINFCNPNNKKRLHKHRLTYTRQLLMYKKHMTKDSVIYFKTDNDELFDDTILYLDEAGFEIYDVNRDTPVSGPLTEHEKMFRDEGIPIKSLCAKCINFDI